MITSEWIAGRRVLIELTEVPSDMEEISKESISKLRKAFNADHSRVLVDLFSGISRSLKRGVLESELSVSEVARTMIALYGVGNLTGLSKTWISRSREFRKAENRMKMLFQHGVHKAVQKAVIDYGSAVSTFPE